MGAAALPFHPAVRAWFARAFAAPTPAQALGWPPIRRGESDAPARADRQRQDAGGVPLLHRPADVRAGAAQEGAAAACVYVSPLKALAVDVERNLRAPLAGIAAGRRGARRARTASRPSRSAPATPRAASAPGSRARRPTSSSPPRSRSTCSSPRNAREALRSVEAVIVDEIHALVPTKRGAHLALSLERLEGLAGRRLQRIGLSATQRPLDEVARFLGGAEARRPGAGRAAAPGGWPRSAPVPAAPRRCWTSSATAGGGVPPGDGGGRRRAQGARAAGRGAGRGHGAPRRAARRPERPTRRRARAARRSGPPSTRGCWSSSARTARRSCS